MIYHHPLPPKLKVGFRVRVTLGYVPGRRLRLDYDSSGFKSDG